VPRTHITTAVRIERIITIIFKCFFRQQPAVAQNIDDFRTVLICNIIITNMQCLDQIFFY